MDNIEQITLKILPMRFIRIFTVPLFRTKNLNEIMTEHDNSDKKLSKCLNAFDLTGIGVGAIVGAGIFVVYKFFFKY